MSSNIVNSELGHSSSPQSSKNMSISMPARSIMTEEPASMDEFNKRASTQSYSSSVSSESSISNNNAQQEIIQQPQQPQPQQKQVTQPPQSPSRAKKLVDKFATFSPKMKSKSDRKLIVETSYWNPKKDGTQSEQRPNKPVESVKQSKKKKRTPINITEGMSQADIFAANVASAVDAAEDDDDDEDYIYSNGHSRSSSDTSLPSGIPHLQTIPFPHMPSDNNYGYQYHMPSNMYNTIPSSHRSYSNYLHRPPFYGSYYNGNTSGSETGVISNQLNRQNNLINSKPTGVMRSSLPDMSQYISHKKGYSNYGSTNYPYNYWYNNDERLPLFAKWRPPPSYETRQRQSCAPTMSSLTVIVVFLLASSYLVFFASTRPLAEVSITDISNVLAADKELMFDVHVKGRNSGLWNIEIIQADLNVFATPVENNGIPGGPGGHWDDDTSNKVEPSEFLGSILAFDEPLVFVAGMNRSGIISEPSGQVRLPNPGGEDQNRWSYIIRRKYDLTVRGVLIYNLPFSKNRRVRVCYVTRVENANGGVNDNDGILSSTVSNDILGACGDWEKEQDMSEE